MSPTGTTRPLRRSMRTASLMSSSPFADAVSTTASAPAPSVQAATASLASPGASASSAPSSEAELASVVDGLDPRHAATGGAQSLQGDQAEQPEPDDDDAIAEGRLDPPHPLERDRADRGEGRVSHRYALGDGDDEVRRHRDGLGVVRAARAGAGDPPANVQPCNAARIENRAGARVPERQVLRHRSLDEADRLADAVVARVAERLRDELGVLDGSRRQGAGAGRDCRALRPARDCRCRIGDEDGAGRRRRFGHLDDLGLSAPQNKLFHADESIGNEGR